METLLVGILDAFTLDLDVIFEFGVAGLEERETSQTFIIFRAEDTLVVSAADRSSVVAVVAIIGADAFDARVIEATESFGAVTIGIATFGANSRSSGVGRGTPWGSREESAVVSLGASDATSGGFTRGRADGGGGVVALVVGVANRESASSGGNSDTTDGGGGQVADGTREPGAVGISDASLASGGVLGDGSSNSGWVHGGVVGATREERRAVRVLNTETAGSGGSGVVGKSARISANTRVTDDGGGGSRRGSGDSGNNGKETGKIANLEFGVGRGTSSVVLATADGGHRVGSETEITIGGLARLVQLAVANTVITAESVTEFLLVWGVDSVSISLSSAAAQVERTPNGYDRETRADVDFISSVAVDLGPVVALCVVQTRRADGSTIEGGIGETDRSIRITIVVREADVIIDPTDGESSGYRDANISVGSSGSPRTLR